MLNALSRLYERKHTKESSSDYNLSDINAKHVVAQILIEKEWWPYAIIDSKVAPSNQNRPNDMAICVRNTPDDLSRSCVNCGGRNKENYIMCQTLMRQRYWFVELKASMGHIRRNDYGREIEVFSITPSNHAQATLSIILWHESTTINDTISKLVQRMLDPVSMMSMGTISRPNFNAIASYGRRNYFTTAKMKSAFKSAGIQVDQRSRIMTDNIYTAKISPPHGYKYVVRATSSSSAGDLNSVLSRIGTHKTKTGNGGAAHVLRKTIHEESK